MCECLPICCVSIVAYIYIHVNKFETKLLFLYLPLKQTRAIYIRTTAAIIQLNYVEIQ